MNQEPNGSPTDPEKNPKNEIIKPPPINPNNQPTLLQEYQGISKHAYEHIDSIYSTFKLVLKIGASMLAIAIGFGTYVTIFSIKDFKKEISDLKVEARYEVSNLKKETKDDIKDLKTEIREDVSNLKTEIRDTVTTLKKEVETRVDKELSMKSIKDLINKKVSERVDIIADDLIEKQITEKISPKIIELDNKLSEISLELNRIKEDRKKLDELNDFTLTFLKALGDDYKAFEQLGNLSADKNFAFPEISLSMYETIRLIHLQHKLIPFSIIAIPAEVDFSKLSFSGFTQLLDSLPCKFHASLIDKIWERKEEEISKREKMSFLIEVLKTSNSLRAKNWAGILFDREYNVNWDPFKMQPIYEKWDDIQKTK